MSGAAVWRRFRRAAVGAGGGGPLLPGCTVTLAGVLGWGLLSGRALPVSALLLLALAWAVVWASGRWPA